jgi:hypothetical protein
MVLVADSGTSGLLRAHFRQREGSEGLFAAVSAVPEEGLFAGRGREGGDSSRLWTEEVSLGPIPWDSLVTRANTSSEVILFLSPVAIAVPSDPAASLQSSLEALFQTEGLGAYELEIRTPERIGLASSGVLGIGLLGILTIWWGTR